MLSEFHWVTVVGACLLEILSIGTAAFGLCIWRIDKRDDVLKRTRMQVQALKRKQVQRRKKRNP
jgi:hypothetical protein